ncbi:MAG: GNAT family N-acetyltransferase [Paramuribaculum sp.]|nr:GNAT family N-acetyltransferase [Paramuribaculum sp.]
MTQSCSTLLKSDRIVLRAPEPDDLDIMTEWENDTRLWRIGSTVAPYSRHCLKKYIDNYCGDIFADQQLRLMVTEISTGGTIGAVDIFEFDPLNLRAAVGIIISESVRKQGFGRESLELTADYCRRRLGLHQLYCLVPEDNEISLSLFKSVGFTITGRLRSWLREGRSYRDVFTLQLLLV